MLIPVRPIPFALAAALMGACAGPPDVPEHPTWADVEPILRGQCNHCHGATADITGSSAAITGLVASAVYRLDFFDVNDGSCGEAAAAISPSAVARSVAGQMRESVASINGNRPRMPPAPAPQLSQWEREVIDRWTRMPPPQKGGAPWTNRMPRLQVFSFPKTADSSIKFSVILSDPDGDPVIGVINGGGSVVKLDRAGSFVVSMDTASWPGGKQALTAVLCDGWGNQSFQVGEVDIAHAPGR
jgi:hypothetical protein